MTEESVPNPKLNCLCKDSVDELGQKVAEVLFQEQNEYAIYVVATAAQRDLCYWQWHKTGYDISPIAAQIGEVYTLAEKKGDSRTIYFNRIAAAMNACLLGHQQEGIEIMNQLQSCLQRAIMTEYRLMYLSACFAFVVCVNLIAVVAVAYKWTFAHILMVTLCGSWGGLVSICMDLQHIDIMIDASKKMHAFAGIVRMYRSIILGWIAYFAISCGLILAPVSELPNVVYIFVIAASYSETMVPDILKKVEKSINSRKLQG